MRRLSEVTSKPVKHVIVTGDAGARQAALDVLKEIYPQADVMTGPGVIRADGREMRITGDKGSLAVEIPIERIRIERGGKALKREQGP